MFSHVQSELVDFSNEEWWKGLFLVASNFAAIPGILYAVRIRANFIATHYLITVLASLVFHTCLASEFCLGQSLNTLRLIDYIFATHLMATVFVWFADVQSPRDVVTDQLVLAFVVVVVILAPFSLRAIVLTLMCGFALLYYKYVIVDEGSPRLWDRIHLPALVPGLLFIGLAGTMFMVDKGRSYWAKHTVWHASSMFGSYLVLLGSSKDAKRWYDMTTALKTAWWGLRVALVPPLLWPTAAEQDI